MPFDSSGHFTRIHNWENDRINDIDIVTDNHDEEDDNFAQGLSLTLLRDGRAPMTADLNLGSFKIKNMANGNSANDAINKGQLDTVQSELNTNLKNSANSLYCLGDIKTSLQAENHGNWLLCDGQAVSRNDYADLFELIGTNFGAGDGINTFNIPDYRGKFLRGLGGDSASDIYTTQAEGLPKVEGTAVGLLSLSETEQSGSINLENTGGNGIGGGNFAIGYRKLTLSVDDEIHGASQHVTPLNQAVNYFIKAKEE